MGKRPHDIDAMMRRIREAVKPYPKAALFELADAGYGSPFEQLVACIVSIRTRDEVTLPTAKRLLERARTPERMAALSVRAIDGLIRASSFHERKARQIREIARRVEREHGGRVPCDAAVLEALPGVGPKCANLVLGIACGQARVSVDVHVHRVTNRWGYVRTRTPERTTAALEEKLPARYRVEINRLLVPFGKHICTRTRPHCSTCPVLEYCRQVGVTEHR
ncbi:MAG TPA: endonuclease III [Longimicrobiales bacterium]